MENFFSFNEKTTIELNSDINILVGINGSGKSNFIRAIKLLYDSVIGKGFETIFLKDWSGFDLVANFNNTKADFIKVTYEFDEKAIKKAVNNQGYNFIENPIYEIIIHRSGATSYYLEEKIYCESKYKGKAPFSFLEMKNAKGSISTREAGEIGLQYYPQENNEITFKTQELVLRQISDPDRYYPIYTLKRAIEGMVVYDYFDTTLKSKIRQPGVFGTEDKLLPNGENLAQILNRLKNGSLLCIDEPEIGLHPDMINTTAKAIKDATHTGTQIIIATHSPLLLNSFELDEILIFEKNENNNSIVTRKTEEDFEGWGEDFLSGQMWLRGELGGKRW